MFVRVNLARTHHVRGVMDVMNREKGYTLIELMIGLLVGLIVLSGVIYAFLATLLGSRDIVNSARLNAELSTLNGLIVGDVRRAGYWASTVASAASPFKNGTDVDLAIIGTDCVLISYDRDENRTISDDERVGFKWVSAAGNSYISRKVSGALMSDCSSGGWAPITDLDFLSITNFSVASGSAPGGNCATLASTACASATSRVIVRYVDIEVTAEVKGDGEWKGRFSDSIRVSNNLVYDP